MKHKKLYVFLTILFLLFILNHQFGWGTFLLQEDGLGYVQELVDKNYPLAVVMYILFTAVACAVLALPGITFAVLAGVMFGPWFGSFFCLIGTTLGAVLAFIAGRYFLKDAMKPVIMKNKYISKILFSDKTENAIILLMITRLLPFFPFNLQNFAYGITDVGIVTYTVATFVFMTPGVLLFTLITAGIIDSAARFELLVLAAVISVLLIFLSSYMKRVYKKIVTT